MEPLTPGAPPRYPEVGVLALVDDVWGHLWQPRHHIVSRLARYYRVLWVEPAADWREHLTGTRDMPSYAWQTPPAFDVLHARSSVPRVYRPSWLADASLHLRWRVGAERLRRLGCRRIVLYMWRPQFGGALDAIPHDLSCYHIDDEYSWSETELPVPPEERLLIERADRVFIHSPALMEKKGGINPRTTCIPNGVDFAAYSRPVPEPPDLAGIPGPRVGYTGFVKRELDFDLLQQLAGRHPEWSFVFVGVIESRIVGEKVAQLQQLPNVYFLGTKSVTDLASYPQHFNVCIMPYRVTDYTKYIYPMKLHEYLASGSPVVGTSIPSLFPFADYIRLASSVEEWEAALRASLDGSSSRDDQRLRRQGVARDHDWDGLAAMVAQSIAADLEVKHGLAGAQPPPRLSIPPAPQEDCKVE